MAESAGYAKPPIIWLFARIDYIYITVLEILREQNNAKKHN